MFKSEILSDSVAKKSEVPAYKEYVKISDPKDPKNFFVASQKFFDRGIDKIKKFKVYEDDIWIITFPKCGTTWSQEMAWLINNDLDYDTALKVNVDMRYAFIEFGDLIYAVEVDTFGHAENLPRPRHIKTHLPVFLLPDEIWTVKPKIIYTVRNPKDTAVSFYHHHRHLHGYRGTKEDFFQAFLESKTIFTPMNEHVLEYWKLSKDNSNILFIFYEDMKKDLNEEVKKVMVFLGKQFTQEQIDKLCDHLSVDSMRKNPATNLNAFVDIVKSKYDKVEDFQFIRSGQIGSYKKELTEEENIKFDEFANHPEFKKYGFSYKYGN